MKIAFIGLGNMGAPMACNLAKADHDLCVLDVVPASVEKVVQAFPSRISAANDLKAVANSSSKLFITMLPASQHVRNVYLGPEGLLELVGSPATFIDCSTIDPQTAREVALQAKRLGHHMLDAPVSGGTAGAQAGTLTFMVGAEDELFEKNKPILASMGKNIVHCGASGNGQVAKVANNMLLAISMIGTAEAMSLGVSLGMDAKVLAGIINTSSGRCWSSELYNPYPGVLDNVPASRGYSGGFGTDLMLKDLGLAMEAARGAKRPVPLGALSQQLYQTFSAQGHGALDFSAIINLLNAV
jgi:3-hydroxyisobutyrate dehydrogenase